MLKLKQIAAYIGPGFVVAATGVGAGDMVTGTVAGANYGVVILWAAMLGAVIKFVLNEGIARWQLATGETLIEGWVRRLPAFIRWYFIVYLLIWSFIVAGALMNACGLAAHSMMPFLPVWAWGMIHSLLAVALIMIGKYNFIENAMKLFVALMFIVVMFTAIMTGNNWGEITWSLFVPRVPEGSAKFILGIIGGVGGSVSLLCYGYWIRENGWKGTQYARNVRIDLSVAYLFTGLFGVAMMIIGAGVNPSLIEGNKLILVVADRLGELLGNYGRWIFLLGFWGAVFSSVLGVWQGIPYLFADFVRNSIIKTDTNEPPPPINSSSKHYRWYLFFLAIPPMLLLFVSRPVWVVIIYSIAGAFFMPFLAAMLLYMNNKKTWVGNFRYTWLYNTVLVFTCVLFVYLLVTEIVDAF